MLRTNLLWAIILIISLAQLAFQAGRDLGSNTNSVSDFYRLDLWANLDGFSNDLMANRKWKGCFTPASVYRVHIRTRYVSAGSI